MIYDAMERYSVWEEHTERIKSAYNWLNEEIMYHVEGHKGQAADKDCENFKKLLEILESALDFAELHLQELYEEWGDAEAM